MPAANRKAPIGGTRSWFVRRNAPCIRAFAMPRSSRATRLGISVLLAESAKVSAVPRMNRTTSTAAMLTVPLTITTTRAASTMARPMFTTTTIRRRSNRSAAAPPRTPNSRTGRYSLRSAIETRNGSRVCDATSSGPAAMTTPSPALLMTVAASSQRKPGPSLPGRDGLGQPAGDESHAGEGTNASRRATRPRGALSARGWCQLEAWS